MKYASFGSRFLAILLDSLIVIAASFVLTQVFSAVKLAAVAPLFQLVLSFGYSVWYQQKYGQTIGKKVLKIKVVDSSGKTPSLMTFFLREVIGKFVSSLILGIGYLWMLWDGKKQTLHDKIASTYVVQA